MKRKKFNGNMLFILFIISLFLFVVVVEKKEEGLGSKFSDFFKNMFGKYPTGDLILESDNISVGKSLIALSILVGLFYLKIR